MLRIVQSLRVLCRSSSVFNVGYPGRWLSSTGSGNGGREQDFDEDEDKVPPFQKLPEGARIWIPDGWEKSRVKQVDEEVRDGRTTRIQWVDLSEEGNGDLEMLEAGDEEELLRELEEADVEFVLNAMLDNKEKEVGLTKVPRDEEVKEKRRK
mmetsp:Transcript_14981/g.30449  ORF Transcript_14981/g.30449 Transcript_14981/m.30449 type:complete len:152 (-) Transcript_14981:622-1077(-)